MDGWAKFGGNLAGALGGGGNVTAYNRGQESAARVQTLLLKAQESRREAMEREQFAQRAIEAGMKPEQAAFLSTALGAGYNPEQVSGYQGDVQEQGFRGDAVARALAGDFGGANANLMGVANGPVQVQQVEDGMLLSNALDPNGAASMTPIGAARAGASSAQAAASYAAAGASNARANLANVQAAAGGFNPNTGGGKLGTYTAPAQGSLLAALGQAGEDGADPMVPAADVRDFAIWRQAYPQFRNGEEALNAYVTAKGGGGLTIIDPSMPGSMTRRPEAPGDLAGALQQTPAAEARNVALDPQAPATVKPRAPITQEFGMQALREAREAIKTGRISREAAQQRMRANGLSNLADRL